MNNTFNIKRLGLLVKRQWLESGKIHLISLGIVAGVIIGFYGLYFFTSIKDKTMGNNLGLYFREPLFFILGILFLTIAANMHFSQLGQKSKLIVELMVPASTLEKFLVGLFFSTFMAFLSYILIFYLIDFAYVSELKSTYHFESVQKNYIGGVGEVVKRMNYPVYFFEKNLPMAKPLYILPFLISSIFFLGSVYFTNSQYVKTMISLMVFCVSFITFFVHASKYLFHDKVKNENYNTNFNGTEWGATIFLIALSIIFWAITYVRLREKEV